MPVKKTSNKTKSAVTMADLLAASKTKINRLSTGQKIKAKLLTVTKNSATFDIGGKSEGLLIDLALVEARDFLKTLKPGDEVEATVILPESKDGNPLLSLRHSAGEAVWNKLSDLSQKGSTLLVVVRSSSDSGLSVEYEGVDGFIPNSQLSRKAVENKEDLIGKSLEVKVLTVEKGRNKIVLSERAVSEAADIKLVEKTLEHLKEGDIYKGIVTKIANFGVFVALNIKDGKKQVKVEGLVHVSELAWEKIQDPAQVINEGQEVEVKVLGFREGKLALSIRQATMDPWQKVTDKYKVDAKIKGKVTRISDFGVFVALEPGVEGLVHMTKIPPATKFKVGDEVNCYIEEVDENNRKIALGLVLTSKPVGYK